MNLKQIKKMISKIGTEGYKDGSSTKPGWLYHPFFFDEFNKGPIHKDSTVKEYETIKADCGDVGGKKILDIGCAQGYFSFNFALQGAEVLAYEGDNLVCDVNEAIKDYREVDNIKFVNKYFGLDEANQIGDFDIIIMMNVHMWIHKQLGPKKTRELMKILCGKTKLLYFQTAHTGGGGAYQVPEFKGKSDIKKYLNSTGFFKVRCLNQNKKWFNRFLFGCKH